MIDYLEKLNSARKIEAIATYVRALGCQLTPKAFWWNRNTSDLKRELCQYAYDANDIEKCETIRQARQILRERGYLNNPKNSK